MQGTVRPLPSTMFMDLDRSGPIPLYYQLAHRIETAIRAGDIPAGSRLENEVSLADQLSLSRPTVRRAIQELVDKGLLVRRRGIGTQVVHGEVTRDLELTSLHEDLVRSGQHPTTRMLRRETLGADAATAEALGIAVDAPIEHLRRLRAADGVPIAVLDNLLPAALLASVDDAAIEEHGLYPVLRARGVNIRVARQRIGARRATAEESRLLETERNSPVLSMTRTAFDSSGSGIEMGHHCYRPDMYAFEVTLVDR